MDTTTDETVDVLAAFTSTSPPLSIKLSFANALTVLRTTFWETAPAPATAMPAPPTPTPIARDAATETELIVLR